MSQTKSALSQIKKRDGRIVSFDQNRITEAIFKAMEAVEKQKSVEDQKPDTTLKKEATKVSDKVLAGLKKKYRSGGIPSIEEIQDVVEETLILSDYAKTAKAYILYRQKRAEIRAQRIEIPEKVRKLAEESKKYFKNPLGEFVFYRSYSRWIPEEGRRETWIEAHRRYIDFMKEKLGDLLSDYEYEEIYQSMLRQEAMPSMRLLWSAGKAARATNVATYNCAFIAPRKLRDFGDIVYALMCGTGVGFSVEEHVVQSLPQIQLQKNALPVKHIIEDSKEGWANALVLGLETWFSGGDAKFDYSKIRPYGSRLNTMGGCASGPEPLKALLNFVREKVLSRQGKRLLPINVHDIICMTGTAIQMGGVRRSAELSLSDLDDIEMRQAKWGQFFTTYPYRTMANNSAVYMEKPGSVKFLDEWIALIRSRSGERGIFNRGNLKRQLPERRWKFFEPHLMFSGTNPCGEVYLISKQFCNLTELVARAFDTLETLLRKIKIATILGTYQSSLTDFHYLTPEWKEHCENERLLGVSITGQWDCPAVRNPEVLEKLKQCAIETNEIYARRFGINPSTCITCVKPSGTVSQLVDAASGMHARHSPYYIRRVRIDASDPLWKMLRDQKIPYHPEVGQIDGLATQYVIEFPVKAPEDAVFRDDLSAIEQLEHWKMVKLNYTEHNPSVTISVGENEWIAVANWLYENWNILGGLAFLPREEHVYELAPYENISQERYEKLVSEFPDIDYAQILAYENDDETSGSQELACTGDKCEL